MMSPKLAVILFAVLVAPGAAALAAIVSAQESDNDVNPASTNVTGDALSCANGGEVESRFSLDGSAWEVTGILETGLTGTITVAGPTGDVSATPTVNLVVSGDPQTGQPVTMAGTTAATGELVATSVVNACAADPTNPPTDGPTDPPSAMPEATPAETPEATPAREIADDDEDLDDEDDDDAVCNRGAGRAGDLLMHVNGGGVHIQRGTVTSFDGDVLLVVTPEGSVVVTIDGDTHLNGDLPAAVEVKVRGDLDELGQIIADEVKVLCPHSGDSDSDDEDGNDGDGDDEDDNSGSGNGNGNGNASGHDKKDKHDDGDEEDEGDDD
jgi:hypothetical protein